MQKQLFITINFDRIFKLFLLFIPIIWLPGITQNGIQFLFFDYGALILFGMSLSFPAKREFKNWNIFVILTISVLTSILVNYKAYPINLIHIISGCLLYFSIVRSLEDVKGVIKVLIWLCFINMFFSGVQYLGFNVLYSPFYQNMAIQRSHFSMPGLMARNYHLAYMLSFITPLVFWFYGLWGLGFALLAGLFIFLIKSYACALSFIIGLLICLSFKINNKRILASILIIFAIFFGCIHKKIIVHKINIRRPAFEYILKESFINPFIGHGIGSFEIDANLYGETPKFESSFNQYLRFIYEFGVIPFLLIGYSFYRYFRKLKINRYLLSSLIALSVYPMFHEVFRFARLSILIITILALYEIIGIKKQEE